MNKIYANSEKRELKERRGSFCTPKNLNQNVCRDFFSEQTKKYYKLFETQTWPCLEISGIRMHCVKGTDPEKSIQQMVSYLGGAHGIVLDACAGLGYASIHLSRLSAVQEIHVFEIDPNVTALSQKNLSSQEFFSNPKIKFKQGNVFEEIKNFPSNFFDCILHDPPSIKIAEELYSRAFYSEMVRVLKPGGIGFHYTGQTGVSKGKNLAAKTLEKLKNAGCRDLTITKEIAGVVFRKHGSKQK